jgi:hypothetical protein
LVTALYQEVVQQYEGVIWEEAGLPLNWLAAGPAAETILQQLQERTRQILGAALLLPVDQALCRALPEADEQAAWLAALAEQGRPFWRYDEAGLAESTRGQTRLESWLLLPGGDESPLARLGQGWPRPPTVRASPQPEELAIVTVRQIYQSISN